MIDLITDSRILSQHNIQRMILFHIKLKYIVNIPNKYRYIEIWIVLDYTYTIRSVANM